MLSDKLTLHLISIERERVEIESKKYETNVNLLFNWWIDRNNKTKPAIEDTNVMITDHQFIFAFDYRLSEQAISDICKLAEKEGFEVTKNDKEKKVVITNRKSYNAYCELYTKLGSQYTTALLYQEPPQEPPKAQEPTKEPTKPTVETFQTVDYNIIMQHNYNQGLLQSVFKYLCW